MRWLRTRVASGQRPFPRPEALHRLDVVEEQIRARTLRKQAQLDAALDKKGIEKFAEHFAAAGAVVGTPRELKYPDGSADGLEPGLFQVSSGSQHDNACAAGAGAGEGNRTLVCSLGSCRSTIELRPRSIRHITASLGTKSRAIARTR